MQTALLVFVASTLGVSFGWQPMPDGSDSYEYIVQLDRELLSQLQRGESIPISTDIPDSVQPIRRIRIVAGNQDLPRRELTTRLKPNTEDLANKNDTAPDVVRGQYTQGGQSNIAPRYSSQPASQDILPANNQAQRIRPRSSQIESSAQDFARSLQRTAEQTRDAIENDIVPRAQAILPKQGSGILPRQSNNILPKQTSPGYDNGIRTANSSSEADIRQLFGDDNNSSASNIRPADRRPVEIRPSEGSRYDMAANNANPTNQNTGGTGQSILPRNNVQSASNNSPQNGSNYTPAGDQSPVTPNGRYAQNNQQTSGGNIAPQQQNNTAPTTTGIQAKWPDQKRFEDAPLAQQYDTQSGRYANSNQGAANVGVPSTGQDNAARASSILGFPNGSKSAQNRQPPDENKTSPTVPEIRREMLNQPVDADMRMASDRPAESNSFPSTPSTQTSSFAGTSFNNPKQPSPQRSAQSNFFGSTPSTETVPTQSVAAQNNAQDGSKGPKAIFPLVLAWVLLSGSGAGNLYLVWSYLDIRNKYRSLVRSAGRKLGRRYLDDRYGDDEYEYDE